MSLRFFCLILFMLLVPVSASNAQLTVYTNEADYVTALTNLGYFQTQDSFENNNDWGLLEIFDVPDVTRQGITWESLGTGLKLNHSIRRTGEWGLTPSPESTPFNGFKGTNTGAQTMHAMGGWVRSGSVSRDVFLYLDGDKTNDLLDTSVGPSPQFFGVIDTNGFNTFEFSTEEVASGDTPKSVFVDDFTFGFGSAPSIREPGVVWSNGAGGAFGNNGNWTGGITPPTANNAIFDLGSAAPYTVGFLQNQTVSQAIISNDSATFNLTGNTLSLTESNITRESLIIGEINGDSSDVAIENGTIAGHNAVVAHSVGSSGILSIRNGGHLNLSNQLRIGSGGTGQLDVSTGSTVTSDFSVIGMFGGNGSANVDGAGAVWNAGSTLNVGMGGTGQLNVINGGEVVATNVSISVQLGNGLVSDAAGAGNLLVSGTGSKLSATNLTLGAGVSTMTVADNATVTTSGLVVIGAPNGSASASVDNATWNGGDWFVGRGGTGSLNVTNGSVVSIESLVAGENATGTNNGTPGFGTVAFDGPSTQVNINSVTIGKKGTSSLSVSNGVTLNSKTIDIGIGADSSAVIAGPTTRVTLTGAGFSPSILSVGAGDQVGTFFSGGAVYKTSDLTISGGAEVVTEDMYLGRTRTGLGTLTVTGAGTLLDAGSQMSGDSYVGYLGNGVLNVTNGATLESGRVFVGRFGIRNLLKGEVNVDGGSSRWNANGIAYVGFNNNNKTQPYTAGSPFFSEGTVNITAGAIASATGLTVGDRRLSKGTVNLNGPGSRFSVGSNGVQIGHLETFQSGFGTSFEGIGFVNVVDGAFLDVLGDIHIDAGTLDLSNASVSANTIFIEGERLDDGIVTALSGDGTIDANIINSGGTIRPGHSAGILDINGDLTQFIDGILDIELGGLVQGTEYDFIDIAGFADLNGTLNVSLINAFDPNPGTFFDVLTASSIQLNGLALLGNPGFEMQIVSGGNGQILRLNTVAVPEPTSFALLTIAGLVGFLGRRRRKKTESID